MIKKEKLLFLCIPLSFLLIFGCGSEKPAIKRVKVQLNEASKERRAGEIRIFSLIEYNNVKQFKVKIFLRRDKIRESLDLIRKSHDRDSLKAIMKKIHQLKGKGEIVCLETGWGMGKSVVRESVLPRLKKAISSLHKVIVYRDSWKGPNAFERTKEEVGVGKIGFPRLFENSGLGYESIKINSGHFKNCMFFDFETASVVYSREMGPVGILLKDDIEPLINFTRDGKEEGYLYIGELLYLYSPSEEKGKEMIWFNKSHIEVSSDSDQRVSIVPKRLAPTHPPKP